MSNKKYIEFMSNFRNRNLWPLPAEFELYINRKNHGKDNAQDPISKQIPFQIWLGNRFETNGPTSTLTLDGLYGVAIPIAESSTLQTLYLRVDGGDIPQINKNYYTAAVLEVNTTPPQRRRITSSKLVYQDGAVYILEFTVNNAFSDAINTAGLSYTITDPTDLSDVNNPVIFVPEGTWLGATYGPNAFVSYFLYNNTRSLATGIPQYRKVSGFDSFTHNLTLNTSESAAETNSSGPVTSWNITDEYILRLDPPTLLGTTVSGNTINNNIPSQTVISLPSSFSNEDNFYKSSLIRILSGAAINQVRLINRYVTLDGVARSGGLNTIQFPTTSSSVDQFYRNAYIEILSGAATGDVRQIINYDGSSRTATVDSNFSAATAQNDRFAIRTLFVKNFDNNISAGNQFEILLFNQDLSHSINYSGSLVSQQESVCYELELFDLILPNKILSVGLGNLISFYPFLYVEIYNVSASSAGNKYPIYTNNPDAYKAVFRVPVRDVPNPVISSFIKLGGNGMVQTLKFKPNDTLHFAVKLPNGELIQYEQSDTSPPNIPLSEIQISSLFGIRRL